MPRNKLITLSFILIIAILLGWKLFLEGNSLPKDIDSSQWQAVFLSDGQVYFGHLKNVNRDFVRLGSVHYLKYGTSLQQGQSGTNQAPSSQNLNLIKLGGEIHGPEDVMFIAKDDIIFIENLKDS